jgi:hypothetical protein
MLVRRVRDAKAPILYANIVGLQNNAKNLVWFDGASEFLGDDGEMRWAAPQNKEGVFVFNPTETKPQKSAWLTGVAENYAMTIEAMRDFYASYGRVIIGLSGGIDSAVSAAMLVEALGPQQHFYYPNIHSRYRPSPESRPRKVSSQVVQADNLAQYGRASNFKPNPKAASVHYGHATGSSGWYIVGEAVNRLQTVEEEYMPPRGTFSPPIS